MRKMAVLLLIGLFQLPAATHARDAAELEQLRQAAEQGDPDARYEMGVLYEYGFQLPKNKPPALAWYMLAANQGHARAARKRDALKGAMTAAEVAEAERLMLEYAGRKTAPAPVPPAAPPAESPDDAPSTPDQPPAR